MYKNTMKNKHIYQYENTLFKLQNSTFPCCDSLSTFYIYKNIRKLTKRIVDYRQKMETYVQQHGSFIPEKGQHMLTTEQLKLAKEEWINENEEQDVIIDWNPVLGIRELDCIESKEGALTILDYQAMDCLRLLKEDMYDS